VRTKVAFRTPHSPYRRLSGFVRPDRAGVAVTLQRRRSDGSWAAASATATSAAGDFAFAITRGGTYRALADAGTGYAAGSATVVVPASRRGAL
jgi:hypothetical protein